MRLLEGALPTPLEISVQDNPSSWCQTGQTCEIKFDLDIETGTEQ